MLAAACGGRPPPSVPEEPDPDRIAIIASERGPQGARLVSIDEHGDRRFALLAAPTALARDTNPAVSPDGAWVVFASSRGRALSETSLWIAPLGVETVPVPLTSGASIDSHPTWTPDGRAIVFASTRGGGDFDLWRQPISHGHAEGEPTQLTSAPGFEVAPTVAADGTVIYAAVTPRPGGAVESRLEARLPDGTIRPLTEGPADTTPALSPDGRMLAFARPLVQDGEPSSELWTMPRDGAVATPLTALPLTAESGPVWSRDGRFVFGTSLLHGDAGVLFSSIVHVDLRERAPVTRMLRDRAGAVARLTPAIVARDLDVAALHEDPEYLPELARIMAAAIEKQRAE